MKRTGFRKPLNHLKVWSPETAPDLTKQLTERLHVSMVDEELPVDSEESRTHRKSWYLGLTQSPDVVNTLGPVRGMPEGSSVVLFEDDVLALVAHLFNASLVAITDEGHVLNGPEEEEERAAAIPRRKPAERKTRTTTKRKPEPKQRRKKTKR